MVHKVSQQVVLGRVTGFRLNHVGGEAEQYDVVGPRQMVLHVRSVLKYNERNSSLREDSVEVCSKGRLLGVHSKSHNVPHQLGIGRFMSI